MSAEATAQLVRAPDHAELVERARKIAKSAEGKAAQTSRDRHVSKETISDMFAAQLMDVVKPAAWGGMERRPSEFYELVYELSRGCGSTGWTYAVLAGHSSILPAFPQSAQEAMWKETPDALTSSAFAPTLRAEKVEGGYRVSGKSPFSSGSDHADWGLLGGMLIQDGAPPQPRLFLIPASDFEIVDDWFVLGLEGTGSKTLNIDGAFVPDDRSIEMLEFFSGPAPFGLQAVMIGTARGAIEGYVEELKAKPGKFGGPAPSETELYQSAIGAAMGDITFAWELLQKVVGECEVILADGPDIPPEQALRNRSATSLISRLCLGAMDRVFELSGGSGVYDGRLSRAYRDVRTGANHAALNATMAARDAGAMILKKG